MMVETSVKNHVFLICINRPEVRNCVNPETGKCLYKAFTEFEENNDLYVAVLYGKGKHSDSLISILLFSIFYVLIVHKNNMTTWVSSLTPSSSLSLLGIDECLNISGDNLSH